MDLRQLRALLAVSEHKSFSAAARALHTVQSNVSTHVARLERELETTLIDRSTGDVTVEGQAVVDRVRRILGELAAIEADVAALRDDIRGEVRMGVIGTTGRWLIPLLLDELRQSYPNIRLIVIDATTTSLVPQLLAGQIDSAVAQLPIRDPDLDTESFFDEERIVVAPADHPLAEKDVISLTELAAHPLLLPPKGNSFRDAVDRETSAAGLELVPLAEIDGMRLLASLAFQGFGPALVPASATPTRVEGVYRRVRVEGLSGREVGYVWRRRSTPSAPARAVHETLRAVVGREVTGQDGLHLTDLTAAG